MPRELLVQVEDHLRSIKPWPAVFSSRYAEKVTGSNVVEAKSHREEIDAIRRNVEASSASTASSAS